MVFFEDLCNQLAFFLGSNKLDASVFKFLNKVGGFESKKRVLLEFLFLLLDAICLMPATLLLVTIYRAPAWLTELWTSANRKPLNPGPPIWPLLAQRQDEEGEEEEGEEEEEEGEEEKKEEKSLKSLNHGVQLLLPPRGGPVLAWEINPPLETADWMDDIMSIDTSRPISLHLDGAGFWAAVKVYPTYAF